MRIETLKTESPKLKAVGYIRVSTEDQAENGISLDNQSVSK